MAEKGFGAKEINLIGSSGTPPIESPGNLNLNANNVAISTNVSIGGTLSVTGNVSVGGTLTYEDVTNIDSVGVVTAREGIIIPDNKALSLGNRLVGSTAGDLRLYHDTNNSYIDEIGSGNLFIRNGSNNAIYCQTQGTVQLYYNGNDKLATSNTGVTVSGTLVATTFSGSGASLTNLPAANLTGTLPAISGANLTGIAVTEAPVTDYTITGDGSHYYFHGGGVDETAGDPDLYLIRGQKYRFNNTTGSGHPFAIRVSNGGSAYTDGVSGDDEGVQFFTVPYAAPASLVYQCTVHSGMVGNIYIRGGASVVTYESTKQIKLGNNTSTSVSSANLVNIDLGGTHLNTAGTTGKLRLYKDSQDEISLGVSGNQMDFILTSTSYSYNFYGGASGTTRIMQLNQSGSINLLLGNETGSGNATPLSINLGGTYSNNAGNGNDLSAKLKMWTDGSDLMGFSVSGNQLDYILTSASYDHVFYGGDAGTTQLARITGDGYVNIGANANQSNHMLYLESTGDAGIHIRADSDNSGENDNPYLSMSQDSSSAQLLKLGMVGDAGQEFAQSIANASFLHANSSNAQPLQLAHMDNLALTISAVESSHFHATSGISIGGLKIANRGNDTGAALLLQGHNNTGTPGQATNTQLTHDGGSLVFEIKHNGSQALHINSTRRIKLPGVWGVNGSSMRTVQIESDGNLCAPSSIREAKINIESISDVSWLYDFNPVTFNFRTKTEVNGENVWGNEADDGGLQYGLIADEVEAVNQDFCFYDDNKLSGVHYDRMIAPLIKALQEQKAEIDALKTRVATLEGS